MVGEGGRLPGLFYSNPEPVMPRSSDSAGRSLWQARMDRFRQSGLTAVEFCRREGVSTPSFYRWRMVLADKRPRATKDAPVPKPQFVPVVMANEFRKPLPTLKLPGGASIDLPHSMEPDQLTTLLRACVAATTGHAESRQ